MSFHPKNLLLRVIDRPGVIISTIRRRCHHTSHAWHSSLHSIATILLLPSVRRLEVHLRWVVVIHHAILLVLLHARLALLRMLGRTRCWRGTWRTRRDGGHEVAALCAVLHDHGSDDGAGLEGHLRLWVVVTRGGLEARLCVRLEGWSVDSALGDIG